MARNAQRRLGAVDAEVVTDRLPATVTLSSLPTPAFEGWTAEDLLTWLRETVPKVDIAERWTDQNRAAVGAGLYRLRDLLGEGQYGAIERELAAFSGVSDRTLQRWRAAYEVSAALPPPTKATKRTESQRARRQTELATHVTSSPPDSHSAKEVPAGPDSSGDGGAAPPSASAGG